MDSDGSTNFVLAGRRRGAVLGACGSLLWVAWSAGAHPCEGCHPKEVAGYSRSSMARSLRRPGSEPEGSFTAASSAAKFTIHADRNATWQRLERAGDISEYPVSYVIGSGSHASGYLIRIGEYLFQSPVCYYPSRHAYDLAPGYEELAAPDFTRPVTEACLLCHSGGPLPVPGSVNRYRWPPFTEEAISCERCHGTTGEHLKRPSKGNIVNPARLPATARDSVCEQCHLAGVVRVLNPGKTFADFHPGQPLEDTFTIYIAAGGSRDFKVISHSEQLALSACARGSQSRLWCGTCHDPHDKPARPAQYYAARCLSCHEAKLSKSHPAGPDCVGCHMGRRPARDGGHSAFTDHRIARRPQAQKEVEAEGDLTSWRRPGPDLEQRNLALALANVGIERRSPALIVRGYRLLTDVQKSLPDDIDVLNGLGTTLLLGKEPHEALRAFERVLQLTPGNPVSEENVGMAWKAAGEFDKAANHLERCLDLDPLQLPAAATLMDVYRQKGDTAKASALAERIGKAMRGNH
jgi:hypothetical protein